MLGCFPKNNSFEKKKKFGPCLDSMFHICFEGVDLSCFMISWSGFEFVVLAFNSMAVFMASCCRVILVEACGGPQVVPVTTR